MGKQLGVRVLSGSGWLTWFPVRSSARVPSKVEPIPLYSEMGGYCSSFHSLPDDQIALAGFMDQVDTGDLLLFRADGCGHSCNRCCSECDYDHVAIALRYGKEDPSSVVLLEASCGDGVQYRQMESRIRNHLDGRAGGTHVAWRQLILQEGRAKSSHWKSTMHKMSEKYKDLPFEDCFSDFLKAWGGRDGGDCCSFGKGEDESQLFCSELVAAIFRDCQLLVPKTLRDTNCYLPKDFTSASNAILDLRGAELADEVLVLKSTSEEDCIDMMVTKKPTKEFNPIKREAMLGYLREMKQSLAFYGGRRSWRRERQRRVIQTWRKMSDEATLHVNINI